MAILDNTVAATFIVEILASDCMRRVSTECPIFQSSSRTPAIALITVENDVTKLLIFSIFLKPYEKLVYLIMVSTICITLNFVCMVVCR